MPEAMRALIVDDEPLARERLRTLLGEERDVEIAGECGDGAKALEELKRGGVDIVFLDVQMPELDGFEVLQALPQQLLPQVVFITAHDRYALKAFEVRAVDYLLKPFDPDRFKDTVQRARERWRERRGQADNVLSALRELTQKQKRADRLLVKESGRVVFVPLEQIEWVEAAGNYVCVNANGATYTARETMAEMEAQLDPKRFVRIHRSAIVNVDRIQELRGTPSGDHVVILSGGRELQLSRSYRDRLKDALGQPV
jgi:two-component system LytT family response regulator